MRFKILSFKVEINLLISVAFYPETDFRFARISLNKKIGSDFKLILESKQTVFFFFLIARRSFHFTTQIFQIYVKTICLKICYTFCHWRDVLPPQRLRILREGERQREPISRYFNPQISGAIILSSQLFLNLNCETGEVLSSRIQNEKKKIKFSFNIKAAKMAQSESNALKKKKKKSIATLILALRDKKNLNPAGCLITQTCINFFFYFFEFI